MLHALAPPAIALGVGLTANAYFFFGNTALAGAGPMALIAKRDLRNEHRLSAGKSSEIFEFFYHAAAVRFVSSALVAATSYFTSAFLQRNSIAASSSLRVRLLCLAGGLSLVPLPYTVLVLLPVNKNLMARAQQSRTDDAQVESKEASDEIDDNLRKWVQLNTVRYSIAGSAYLAALYALLL